MKALVFEEKNKLVYKEISDPEILPNEVLVKVHACGICGSDVYGMDGSSGRRIPPIIMGDEASGVISKTGKNVKGWRAGDRVTFDSTATFNSRENNIIENIRKLTENCGANIGIEAGGITTTVKLAIESVRKGATKTLVGNLTPVTELPLQTIVTRQLRLQGSCAISGEYPAALSMIEQGRINGDKILSATAPLSEGAQWFKRLYEKEKGLLKVILKP